MILADTSVWIDHFRVSNPRMESLIRAKRILVHPDIIGELACGNLRHRAQTLADLRLCRRAIRATTRETLEMIEAHRLYGLGLGWVDAGLLASALLTGCGLWTLDRRLAGVAANLSLPHGDVLKGT